MMLILFLKFAPGLLSNYNAWYQAWYFHLKYIQILFLHLFYYDPFEHAQKTNSFTFEGSMICKREQEGMNSTSYSHMKKDSYSHDQSCHFVVKRKFQT